MTDRIDTLVTLAAIDGGGIVSISCGRGEPEHFAPFGSLYLRCDDVSLIPGAGNLYVKETDETSNVWSFK